MASFFSKNSSSLLEFSNIICSGDLTRFLSLLFFFESDIVFFMGDLGGYSLILVCEIWTEFGWVWWSVNRTLRFVKFSFEESPVCAKI